MKRRAVLRDQAEGYIKAIQWNLNYYYNGLCSWSWYYPHHYSPYISDIQNFKDMKIEFESGKPFLPFEQLLAVLPSFRYAYPGCSENDLIIYTTHLTLITFFAAKIFYLNRFKN